MVTQLVNTWTTASSAALTTLLGYTRHTRNDSVFVLDLPGLLPVLHGEGSVPSVHTPSRRVVGSANKHVGEEKLGSCR